MDEAFAVEGLAPNLVFTATDADVIKTYVRSGLGIGVIAEQAYDAKHDSDLVRIDVSHLFEDSITNIGFRRGAYMRRYMYRFLTLFAAHLDFSLMDKVQSTNSKEQLAGVFKSVSIPRISDR